MNDPQIHTKPYGPGRRTLLLKVADDKQIEEIGRTMSEHLPGVDYIVVNNETVTTDII